MSEGKEEKGGEGGGEMMRVWVVQNRFRLQGGNEEGAWVGWGVVREAGGGEKDGGDGGCARLLGRITLMKVVGGGCRGGGGG